MPTVLPRTQITHTNDVQHALDVAQKRWPGQRPGVLLLRLIEEGARSIEASNADAVAQRRADIERVAVGFKGVYRPGDLEALRQEWPA